MANGIIIDVGFKAQVEQFKQDLEKNFKTIDFEEYLNLSSAFDKQEKEVKLKLESLSKAIDDAINGKIGDEPIKQINELKSSVSTLAKSFKAMQDAMPATMARRYEQNFSNMNRSAQEMIGTCEGVTNAIEDISNAANGANIQIVDKTDLERQEQILKTTYKGIRKTVDQINEAIDGKGRNKKGDTPFVDTDEILTALNDAYLRMEHASQKFYDSFDSGDTKAATQYAKTFGDVLAEISKDINQFNKLGGDLQETLDIELPIGGFVSVESLKEQVEGSFEDVKGVLLGAMDDLKNSAILNFGIDLDEWFKRPTGGGKQSLKIPIDVSTNKTALYNSALKVINDAQELLKSHPLEVEVQLMSTHWNRKNKERLEEIRKGLENIDDEEIRAKTNALIDEMHKGINEALLFEVKINTENAMNAVRWFSDNVKSQMKDLSSSLNIYPNITITDEKKADLQAQIDTMVGDSLHIDLSVVDVENSEEIKYIENLKTTVKSLKDAIRGVERAYILQGQTANFVFDAENRYLDNLFNALYKVHSEVTKTIAAFSHMPKNLKIDVEGKSVEDLLDDETLEKLTQAQESIIQASRQTLGRNIILSKENADDIISDVNSISTSIKNALTNRAVDDWTDNFLSKLGEISNKIQSIFGDNELSRMLTGWISDDNIMKQINGVGHNRERSAVVGENNRVYGDYMYDQEGSTSFILEAMKKALQDNTKALIALHSHGSDNITAMSVSQYDESKKLQGGDFVSFYEQLQYGIEKQLIVGLKDITEFDAKAFFADNGFNYKNGTIPTSVQKKLALAAQNAQNEISQNYGSYIEKFIDSYGEFDPSIFKYNFVNLGNDVNSVVGRLVEQVIDPDELMTEFKNQLKSNSTGDIGTSLSNAVLELFKRNNVSFESLRSLGVDENDVEKTYSDFINHVIDKGHEFIQSSLNLDGYTFKVDNSGDDANYRDLFTYAMRENLDKILSEGLGSKYKHKITDPKYMKVHDVNDFLANNELGLSANSLNKFLNSAPQSNVLNTLDKIVSDLEKIKTLSSSTSIDNVINSNKDYERSKAESSLTPLENLEMKYKDYKNFYDNNQLDSEAGARAALAYYDAYMDAINAKINKNDLRNNTIDGKVDKLFTGDYRKYKKDEADLDLTGIESEISKYQEIVNKFNNPEVVNAIKQITDAIEQMMQSGVGGKQTIELLKQLNGVITKLGADKGAERIEKIAKNLEDLQTAVSQLDIQDNGFVSQLNSILEKGDELKALGEVLKSTKKQIDAADKATKEKGNYDKAANYMAQNSDKIKLAVENAIGQNNTTIYQNMEATKDGIVKVITLVKDATDAYHKYTVAVDENNKAQVLGRTDSNDPKLQKEIRQLEAFEKMRDTSKNLGDGYSVFEFGFDEFQAIVDKAEEFGIKLEDIRGITRNIDQDMQESFQLTTKMGRITIGMNSDEILYQRNTLENVDDLINQIGKDIKSAGSAINKAFKGGALDTQSVSDSLNDIINNLQRLEQLRNTRSDKIDIENLRDIFDALKSDIGTFSVDKIEETISQGKTRTPEIMNQLADLRTLYSDISNIDFSNLTSMDVSTITEYTQKARELFKAISLKENQFADIGQVDKVLKKLYKDLNDNSAMSSELKQQYQELIDTIKSMDGKILLDTFKNLTNQQLKLSMSLEEANKKGKSFIDMIKSDVVKKSAGVIAQYFSLYDIIRYGKQAIEVVKQFDSALTEMRKVSDESVESLKRYQKATVDVARSVGSTAVEIQQSTADWMRLGSSLKEASELAKNTAIYSNVGDMDISTATEHMISAMKAFNLEAEDSLLLVDKMNEIGNNYAISSAGIGEALERSSAALVAAGNSVDQAIALITAGNTISQDADAVGNALKVVSLRIRGSKSTDELEEMGEETEDLVASTSKLREEIMGLTGVDIMKNSQEYKSTYDILVELSEVWDKLSDVSQANVLEKLAGKTRSSVVAGLLSQAETLKSVYEDSVNAAGSATEENEKYLESIEGKINQFTNEASGLINNIISSDLIKGVVDLGTGLMKVLDVLENIGALLPTIFAGFAQWKGVGRGKHASLYIDLDKLPTCVCAPS